LEEYTENYSLKQSLPGFILEVLWWKRKKLGDGLLLDPDEEEVDDVVEKLVDNILWCSRGKLFQLGKKEVRGMGLCVSEGGARRGRRRRGEVNVGWA
jgi:hypothetical protein